MILTLRRKLVVGFLMVIAITGAVTTFVGTQQIRVGVIREAQNKVSLDLNSASQIYIATLEDVAQTVRHISSRTYSVQRAIRDANRALLLDTLTTEMRESRLDILTLTDTEGRVLLRTRNPDAHGDMQADDEIVRKVLSIRRPVASTQIVSREELLKESAELAERARIALIPTPHAKPSPHVESTSGMLLKAAAPVFEDTGAFAGVLYGGILLNRNYEIVDRIKDIVYRGVTYEGTEIGTATIFQGDIRISTNVMSAEGTRAIGTRVSSEVSDRVIGQGETWAARAFVVNDWYLTAYEPIRNTDGSVIGILYVGMLEKKYNDMKMAAMLTFLGVALGGAFVAFLVAYRLSRTISEPIRALTQGVEAIAKGDFNHRVEIDSADEIGILARSFNRVQRELKETYEKLKGRVESADEDLKNAYRELREKQKQLVEAEKLASMGQLSAGLAHELNNPLGTILLYSHMLLRGDAANRPGEEHVRMIVAEATRCKDIVRGLLDFARQSRVSKTPTNLSDLVNNVLEIMAQRARGAGVRLAADLSPDLREVMLDPKQITQALVNLVQNSIDASPEGGEIRISVHALPEDRSVELEVSDQGTGIPSENLSKLFTPFFTTKEISRGTGLGLAITYGVVKMHEGDITIQSEEGEGTTVTIRLPAE